MRRMYVEALARSNDRRVQEVVVEWLIQTQSNPNRNASGVFWARTTRFPFGILRPGAQRLGAPLHLPWWRARACARSKSPCLSWLEVEVQGGAHLLFGCVAGLSICWGPAFLRPSDVRLARPVDRWGWIGVDAWGRRQRIVRWRKCRGVHHNTAGQEERGAASQARKQRGQTRQQRRRRPVWRRIRADESESTQQPSAKMTAAIEQIPRGQASLPVLNRKQ